MSHYFSRVQLIDWPDDMELLASLARHGEAYRDHALMWKLFAGDDRPRDFVFRRNQVSGGKDIYYVVSARPPRDVPGLFRLQSKPYAPTGEQGACLRFDLRANPVVTRRARADAPGKRHDVLMNAKQAYDGEPEHRADFIQQAAVDWLLRKAEGWGLAVRPETVAAEAYTQHKLRHRQRSIEFSSLDYQGVAYVEDAELLGRALREGVGHARAFGCGLLLVKRVD